MDLKQLLDAVASLGALGFAIIVIWAFLTDRLYSAPTVKAMLADKDATILYERGQKDQAVELTKRAFDSHDRIADAVEERNRLDRERLLLSRQGQHERHDDV